MTYPPSAALACRHDRSDRRCLEPSGPRQPELSGSVSANSPPEITNPRMSDPRGCVGGLGSPDYRWPLS
jgi:hypothetical protein